MSPSCRRLSHLAQDLGWGSSNWKSCYAKVISAHILLNADPLRDVLSHVQDERETNSLNEVSIRISDINTFQYTECSGSIDYLTPLKDLQAFGFQFQMYFLNRCIGDEALQTSPISFAGSTSPRRSLLTMSAVPGRAVRALGSNSCPARWRLIFWEPKRRALLRVILSNDFVQVFLIFRLVVGFLRRNFIQ